MMWHNDWIWHNLDERQVNKNTNFKFGISPYSFKDITFEEASRKTAEKIYDKYKKIYVGLSGGMDSLYVTKVFHECGIPFVPIIILSEANTIETQYAFNYCEENGIEPHVIRKTGRELVEYYVKNVYAKMFSVGLNISGSVIAGQYAKENQGILVSGDYLVDVKEDLITCSDYDYFKDILIGKNINFFSYDPAIAYSMTKESVSPFYNTKFRLYRFSDNRNKINYRYNDSLTRFIINLNQSIPKEKYEYTLMSKQDFLSEMQRYIV